MKWLKWCPFGCGKHVRYHNSIPCKLANNRKSKGLYKCSKCGRIICINKSQLARIYKDWSNGKKIILPKIALCQQTPSVTRREELTW